MLRKARPHTFRARGLSDTIDSTNTFPGAMQSLANMIPSATTRGFFVPRPASAKLTDFSTWGVVGAAPAQGNGLLVVGNIAYGLIAATAGTYAGKDVPFAYNLATGAFETVNIPGGAAALPTTPATSGDWTPPILSVVGSYVMVTHPGFAGGGGNYFGWFDISGFSSNTITGNTNGNKTINNLSADVLNAGWTVGMTFTSGAGDIPANTTITSIAADGLSLTISKNATASNVGDTFTVAGGTATAPLWGAGNTNGNPLSAVPVAVAQFNGRAYFAVKNGLVFSDSGNPLQVTNATQAITFQNGLAVTALAGLPLSSTQIGGIIQSLIAFQGDAQAWQVTGDQSSSFNQVSGTVVNSLQVSALNISVGTLAALTICPTPQGLAFVAPDGVRIINFLAQVSDPLGADGNGVSQAFLYAQSPSRMCAAFNQNVLRISVENGSKSGSPVEEYWYDFSLKTWTGPHSFPASQIQPWQASTNTFVMFGSGVSPSIWQSDPQPNSNSTYTENGSALACTWATSLTPDNQEMTENCIIESMLGCSLPPGIQITVQVINEASQVLDSLTLAGPAANPTEWDVFKWDVAPWDGGASYFVQQPLSWHQVIVFKQAQFRVTAPSMTGYAIGNLNLRIQSLGYQTQEPIAV